LMTVERESFMKQPKWSLLIILVLLSSLCLHACSFTVQTLATPSSPEDSPASPLSEPTSTQTAEPLSLTETPPAPLATPTLISIRADTIPMLEVATSFSLRDVVHSLAFTRDGSVLAASGGNDQDFSIQLWDVVNGYFLNELDGHTGIVWDLAFSPDGQYLASVSSDKTARIWDWRNKTLLQSLDFPGQVVSVSFSPDGQTLAVGGVDEPVNQIQNAAIWTFSVGSWKPGQKRPEYLDITAMAYSPDGRWLVGGGTSRNVQVWRASDGGSVLTLSHAHQVAKAAVSPDSSTVATATCQTTVNEVCTEGGVWVWDLLTGKLVRRLAGFADAVESVAFSADGSTLIAASRNGTLGFYTTSDYTSVFEFAVPGGISAMSASPDGGFLATGNVNGGVQLWKVVYHP
jgi:WD40 repeat protein